MEENKILAELKAKLTGSAEDDNKFLRAEAERFAAEKNLEGVDAATQLLIELMPEGQRAEIDRLIHIDGMRLDEMHDKIMALIKEKNMTEAKSFAERLYKKITVDYKEDDKAKFVSLRNPFEDNLYQLRYKPEKVLNRTPFDFATFITTYGYLLVETGSPLDAIPVLEKAMEYNPLDCGPKFELAEVYKLLKNKRMTLEVSRDALKSASSPVAIARCYANAGYALTEMGEYDDAFVFLSASVFFAPHPAIPFEMRDLVTRKGKPIKEPSREDMIEVLKKYDFGFGADQDVISVAAQLSAHYLMEEDIPNALKALKMTYNLTRDEQVKEIIMRYEPDAPMVAPIHENVGDEPQITQTVNDSPEN